MALDRWRHGVEKKRRRKISPVPDDDMRFDDCEKSKLTLLTNFFVDCADASTLGLRDTSNDGLAKLKREEVRMA